LALGEATADVAVGPGHIADDLVIAHSREVDDRLLTSGAVPTVGGRLHIGPILVTRGGYSELEALFHKMGFGI